MPGLRRGLGVLLLALATAAVGATPEYGGGIGRGAGEDVAMLRLGVGGQLAAFALGESDRTLQPRWEAIADVWEPVAGADGDTLAAAGLRGALATPFPGLGRGYLEVGSGVLLLTDHDIVDGLDLGTRFQFDSHLGIGLYLDAARRWSLAYEFHHASNAGIDDVNPGINFHLMTLRYRP